MARLTDPDILAQYKQALNEWAVGGAVELLGRAAEELRTTLPGVSQKFFKECLCTFVCVENGEIDQVKEQREPYCKDWEWHYDLRPTINGVKLYVETRLYPESFSSHKDPMIQIFRVKPA